MWHDPTDQCKKASAMQECDHSCWQHRLEQRTASASLLLLQHTCGADSNIIVMALAVFGESMQAQARTFNVTDLANRLLAFQVICLEPDGIM